MSAARRPPTVVVGAGRLARAILPPLLAAGWPVERVRVRSEAAARRLRRAVPGVTVGLHGGLPSGGLVVLAVPDRAVADVASDLAGEHPGFRGVALHCSGSLAPAAVAPLGGADGSGVLHPLQTLGPAGARALAGSRALIDGGTRARKVAARLARALGLRPLRVGRALDDDARAAYHAAAAVASNDLVALLAIAVDGMEAAGVEPRDALDGLIALARGALDGVESGGLAGGLTGPVVRGDVATLRRHLDVLARSGGDDAAVHRLLSRRLLPLAARAPGGPGAGALARLARLLGGGRARTRDV